MKKLMLLILIIVLGTSCEKEILFNVRCEFNYIKYEQGIVTQTGQTVREFYSDKTAKELEEQFTGDARVFDKYELHSIAKCVPI